MPPIPGFSTAPKKTKNTATKCSTISACSGGLATQRGTHPSMLSKLPQTRREIDFKEFACFSTFFAANPTTIMVLRVCLCFSSLASNPTTIMVLSILLGFWSFCS